MTDDSDLIAKVLDSKVVEKAYGDGVGTPLKEASAFAADLIKGLRYLLPVEYLAARQDIRTHKLKQRIEEAIKQVPEENRIVPPPSISIPIINHLSYIFDMYLGHLEKLDLICVSDKQSEPIWRDGSNNKEQIGIRVTYTMGFTKFGDLFKSACLPDNEQAL